MRRTHSKRRANENVESSCAPYMIAQIFRISHTWLCVGVQRRSPSPLSLLSSWFVIMLSISN